MSPVRTSARERARRRELRKLMAHVAAVARETLKQAVEEGLVKGHIAEDGTIVIEAEPGAPANEEHKV